MGKTQQSWASSHRRVPGSAPQLSCVSGGVLPQEAWVSAFACLGAVTCPATPCGPQKSCGSLSVLRFVVLSRLPGLEPEVLVVWFWSPRASRQPEEGGSFYWRLEEAKR